MIDVARQSKAIIALAADNKLPVVYGPCDVRRRRRPDRLWCVRPWKFSSVRGAHRQDIKGEGKRIAVEERKKLSLVVNLKTAKALGLTVPPTLLARADEVIE